MDEYRKILDLLSRFFDTERGGTVPFRREDYNLEPLRDYLRVRDALRPARRVVHVGGTKGKGSVTTLVAALLHGHGLSVGSYFSPHLVSYRERIQIDGRAVDEACFAEAVGRVYSEKPDPGGSAIRSVFEALTAAAALLFRTKKLDAAVMEVGLGGRLDATNVLETDVSVLTPISLDHMEVLGDSVSAIARDKAGILRPGNPAVIGPQTPEGLEVLLRCAEQVKARPLVSGKDFWTEARPEGMTTAFADGLRIEGLRPAMAGEFQKHNAAIALAAAREALGQLDPEVCRQVVASTRMAGRLQEVQLTDGGTVVLDGAHNPFAAEVVATEARRLYGTPLEVMVGISSNKDAEGILRPLLQLGGPLLCVSFGGPRSMDSEKLAELARKLGATEVLAFPRVEEAWTHWLGRRADSPKLLATGSLFLVGKLLRVLHSEGRAVLDPPPDPEP